MKDARPPTSPIGAETKCPLIARPCPDQLIEPTYPFLAANPAHQNHLNSVIDRAPAVGRADQFVSVVDSPACPAGAVLNRLAAKVSGRFQESDDFVGKRERPDADQ